MIMKINLGRIEDATIKRYEIKRVLDCFRKFDKDSIYIDDIRPSDSIFEDSGVPKNNVITVLSYLKKAGFVYVSSVVSCLNDNKSTMHLLDKIGLFTRKGD